MNWWKVCTELCYDTWSSALQGQLNSKLCLPLKPRNSSLLDMKDEFLGFSGPIYNDGDKTDQFNRTGQGWVSI